MKTFTSPPPPGSVPVTHTLHRFSVSGQVQGGGGDHPCPPPPPGSATVGTVAHGGSIVHRSIYLKNHICIYAYNYAYMHIGLHVTGADPGFRRGGFVHSEGGGGSYRNFRSGSKLLQGPGQINKQKKYGTLERLTIDLQGVH